MRLQRCYLRAQPPWDAHFITNFDTDLLIINLMRCFQYSTTFPFFSLGMGNNFQIFKHLFFIFLILHFMILQCCHQGLLLTPTFTGSSWRQFPANIKEHFQSNKYFKYDLQIIASCTQCVNYFGNRLNKIKSTSK